MNVELAGAHTLTVAFDLDAGTVFDAFTDPRHLPSWARASGVRRAADGWWTLDTPNGEATIRFQADRATLIADHEYRDAKRRWHVPARVVREAADDKRCALTLTLFRPAGMDDAAFARQIAAVQAELESFRHWIEAGDASDG